MAIEGKGLGLFHGDIVISVEDGGETLCCGLHSNRTQYKCDTSQLYMTPVSPVVTLVKEGPPIVACHSTCFHYRDKEQVDGRNEHGVSVI
jgi:hypothetical protein